ncbi:hypothetical protein GALL_153550 [mine drainage metagenome]|uniref:Uncharacterized protein n=1 Tax=mine drainage metagenome TaxID=410659 RepID=A0A1J5S2L2_9ZZZZ
MAAADRTDHGVCRLEEDLLRQPAGGGGMPGAQQDVVALVHQRLGEDAPAPQLGQVAKRKIDPAGLARNPGALARRGAADGARRQECGGRCLDHTNFDASPGLTTERSGKAAIKGVLPFLVTDILRLAILIAFPIIALYLPDHV